jgi:hypothetical protein
LRFCPASRFSPLPSNVPLPSNLPLASNPLPASNLLLVLRCGMMSPGYSIRYPWQSNIAEAVRVGQTEARNHPKSGAEGR